jgi:ArsR family transcriptional regulator
MITPTAFYKCLADDTRLIALLLISLEQELCVCEIMQALDEQSQPKVSRHLAQLKTSGLVVARRQKQWVFYALNPELEAWAKEVITLTVKNNPSFLQAPLARLSTMGDRPQRIKNCCD